MLLNDLLNNKSNKKNTIHHLYRITINLLEYAYISSYVGCTYIILFTCIINRIQEKKANHLHTSFSYHIHIVTFGSVNMYTIHQTNYNLTTEKNITPTKICFLSDVHYPNANNPQRLKKNHKYINES